MHEAASVSTTMAEVLLVAQEHDATIAADLRRIGHQLDIVAVHGLPGDGTEFTQAIADELFTLADRLESVTHTHDQPTLSSATERATMSDPEQEQIQDTAEASEEADEAETDADNGDEATDATEAEAP